MSLLYIYILVHTAGLEQFKSGTLLLHTASTGRLPADDGSGKPPKITSSHLCKRVLGELGDVNQQLLHLQIVVDQYLMPTVFNIYNDNSMVELVKSGESCLCTLI